VGKGRGEGEIDGERVEEKKGRKSGEGANGKGEGKVQLTIQFTRIGGKGLESLRGKNRGRSAGGGTPKGATCTSTIIRGTQGEVGKRFREKEEYRSQKKKFVKEKKNNGEEISVWLLLNKGKNLGGSGNQKGRLEPTEVVRGTEEAI